MQKVKERERERESETGHEWFDVAFKLNGPFQECCVPPADQFSWTKELLCTHTWMSRCKARIETVEQFELSTLQLPYVGDEMKRPSASNNRLVSTKLCEMCCRNNWLESADSRGAHRSLWSPEKYDVGWWFSTSSPSSRSIAKTQRQFLLVV